MTSRSRIVLFTSVMISGLVIAGAVANLRISLSGETVSYRYLFTPVVMIALAITAVPFVYYSKVARRRYEKLLQEDYYVEYEVIRDAVLSSQLAPGEKREIKEDVLELFLSAQEAGRPIKDVVENTDKFVQDILRAYGSRRLTLLNVMDGIIFSSSIFLAVEIMTWLEQTDKSFFDTRMEFGLSLFLLLIAFVLLPAIKKAASKRNALTFVLPLGFGIGFVLFSEALRRFCYGNGIARLFLEGTINVIPNGVVLALVILAIPAALFIKTTVRRRFLKTLT